ncbi:MAG: gluconokinase [Gammaproteobacteria bacterium]
MTRPQLIVCMGVSGSGKSTFGQSLAQRLKFPFLDADDLHTSRARHNMSAGIGLSEAERTRWMDRVCAQLRARTEPCVMAHSALQRHNRERLRDCGMQVVFLYLDISAAAIALRLARRRDHFASASLLPSQFRALEKPENEPDVHFVAADKNVASLVDSTCEMLKTTINLSSK